MALNKSSLKSRIVMELEALGFATTGTHAFGAKLAQAIANAVVDEILANAVVTTTSGAPDGEHTGVVT